MTPPSPAWLFDTVLIANRGEIARRVIRTAKRLGLRTVAVYSDADIGSPHVREADEAVRIGPAPAKDSYLNADAVLDAAARTGAGAVHPGYGFLSENADFARKAQNAGLVFVGPTPEQLEAFGVKHTARELARKAGVPLMPGTGLLASADEAVAGAAAIGYPVMVKATEGGGGIGLLACADGDQVRDAFERVRRLAAASFGADGVFAERLVRPARHVEVQVFGDGTGNVAVLGDRDCSLQRRNQKVIEEAPAPALPADVRRRLHAAARDLAASVRYASAGTVEFVYDPVRREASFLEVNARLQVEHPVTEEVLGIDLVEQMLRLAGQGPGGVAEFLAAAHVPSGHVPRGHAIEARIYAEDPAHGGRPSPGLVTAVRWPENASWFGSTGAEGTSRPENTGSGNTSWPDSTRPGNTSWPDNTSWHDYTRVDGWIEAGLEVSAHYDPMIAKIVVRGEDRADALARMAAALARTRIDGVATNLGLLRAAVARPEVTGATHSTSTLAGVTDPEPRIEVVAPGTLTTIQDWPGRTGYWQVGVPPSGPMDDVSLREVNLAVGNPEGAPALECTATGPSLRFSHPAVVCLGGAESGATLNGLAPDGQALDGQALYSQAPDGQAVNRQAVPWWTPFRVPAGATLDLGAIPGPGLRAYLAVRGGFDVPEYLGSRATFTLGRFGGHGGRALRAGDVLRPVAADGEIGLPVPLERRPAIVSAWEIGVTEGPHAAPEFFTREDIETLYASTYTVHHNSARTGVRLTGPRPAWAREDGGEAGLHPSNIHDTAYAVGALDFTGDTPIILGPDGPSLGGFVCPAVVASGELWKTGQLRPGDTVRFVPVRESEAAALRRKCASVSVPRPGASADRSADRSASHGAGHGASHGAGHGADDGILARRDGADGSPGVVYRRDGDGNVLVEYGEPVLDLGLRMRVHALVSALEAEGIDGVLDYTPGIRSLQVHTDPERRRASSLVPLLQKIEDELPPTHRLRVPSRTVRLPLSWDDPATRLAIERYMSGVRSDAPWTPWNIEFIRRINGLASVDDVRAIVFGAKYLVLGLGDVYLGAPVATPVDPRHRLVTTKYNPARTWTAENSVGIGGAYLCIYGMEGPGGYQFVGRTIQVWNRWRRSGMFSERPWALRFFDQIEWYPVSAEELTDLRAETEAGRGPVDVTDGEFDYGSYRRFLADNAASIADFRDRQAAAFATEKERWRASGEFDVSPDPVPAGPGKAGPEEIAVPDGAAVVTAPLPASVWRIDVRPGDRVAKGDPLLSLEAMKMETALAAPRDGTVAGIYTTPGAQVDAGQILATIVTGEPPAAPAARETPGALHAGGAPDVPEAPDAGGASDEYAIHMARGI